MIDGHPADLRERSHGQAAELVKTLQRTVELLRVCPRSGCVLVLCRGVSVVSIPSADLPGPLCHPHELALTAEVLARSVPSPDALDELRCRLISLFGPGTASRRLGLRTIPICCFPGGSRGARGRERWRCWARRLQFFARIGLLRERRTRRRGLRLGALAFLSLAQNLGPAITPGFQRMVWVLAACELY